MSAHAGVRGIVWRQQRTRDPWRVIAGTNTCVLQTQHKECAWSVIRLLWLFRLRVHFFVYFSFSHRVSLAVLWQILWRVIAGGCVLRQHGICGHGSSLWQSLSKWRVCRCFVMVPVCGFVSGVW